MAQGANSLPFFGRSRYVYPPNYGPDSDPPAIFDGTTRLYLSYVCPYARRAWITVNYKGLHDEVEFIPFDLKNKPAWYKEKVYPPDKVPAFEHNKNIFGESLEVVKYMDTHFKGPKLIPMDPARKRFSDEMLAYSNTFINDFMKWYSSQGDPATEVGPALDHIDKCLTKFRDGPFFVGPHFSIADVGFVTFVEFAQKALLEKKYDITAGRTHLKKWIEVMNKVEAYTETKTPPYTLRHGLALES